MMSLLAPLRAKTDLNFYVLLASIVIHILGLTSTIFVMLVYGRYLSHGLDSTLYTLASGAIVGVLAEIVLRRARFRIVASLCTRENRLLSEKVTHTLLNARSEAVQRSVNESGDGGAPSWLEKIEMAMSPQTILAIIDFPFAFLLLAVVFMLSWQLALCTLVVIVLLLVTLAVLAHKMKGLNEDNQAIRSESMSLFKSAELAETVRVNNAQEWLTSRIEDKTAESRWAKYQTYSQQDAMQTIIRSASMLLSIIVISVGAALTVHGDLNFGLLIGANILATRLIALISMPIQQLPIWLNATQASQKLNEFLGLPVEPQKGTQLPKYHGKLRFQGVVFGYPSSPTLVHEGLSFELNEGEKLLVVGSNGTGKTTLARLIAGLLVPRRGSISVDGVELRQVNAHWWREQLVYLPQDPDLLPGTLRENMTFLNGGLTDADIFEALKRVSLGDWIEHHPDGLDMKIQMRGRNLSLGIRRRVAFARALLTKGQLVVIDEPLEGLDRDGITMMQRVLAELDKEKRSVIIMSQFMQNLSEGTKVVNLDTKQVTQASKNSQPKPAVGQGHADQGNMI